MTARAQASGQPASDILMLYLEPAPYIVGFIEAARQVWPGRIDVLYAAVQMSQEWHFQPREGDAVLPAGRGAAIAEIRRRLSSGRYGLVHLAGWGHPLLIAAMVIARAYGVPVVMESDTPRPADEARWKSVIKRVFYPWLLSMPKMFLPGGTRQAAYLKDYGVGEARIRVAQMTVDVAAIQAYVRDVTAERRSSARSQHGLGEGDTVILYVGRLEPHKGVEDLLAAFAALVRDVPNVRLVLAGDGSLRERVTAAAATNPAIRYLGRLSGDALWEAYAIADIFALASHFEPWGLVVNEAMAAGLPVIVTDRVGCGTDLVQEGRTGLVVRSGEPTALRAALATLCRDGDLRARMSAAARDIISGWTLANQARNTAAAWRAVLSPSGESACAS